jgi:nitrite reductase (NADH) small subunit
MGEPALASPVEEGVWVRACRYDDILPESGVAVLLGGVQIAVVRAGGAVYAISNFDPFSHAYVISRGIVGDKGGVAKIASPVYKQNFALDSGRCLDDPSVSIPVYPVRVSDGFVEILLIPE